jgi:hypothetical protein
MTQQGKGFPFWVITDDGGVMPGPNSLPSAMRGLASLNGKTALHRARVRSGEGMRWNAEYRRRETRGAEIAKRKATLRAAHVKRR